MERRDGRRTRRIRGSGFRVHQFQRPPEHFGAHVDAECGLDSGPGLRRLGRRRRERGGERALRGALGRFLQDGVDDMVGGRRDRRRMGSDDRLPPGADPVLVAGEQGRFPDQADREEIDDGRVRAAVDFRLPEPVARILRPAAQRRQHRVEIGLEGLGGEREAPHRAPRSPPALVPAPPRHRPQSREGRRSRGSDHGSRRRARRHRRSCRAAPPRAPVLRRNSLPPSRPSARRSLPASRCPRLPRRGRRGSAPPGSPVSRPAPPPSGPRDPRGATPAARSPAPPPDPHRSRSRRRSAPHASFAASSRRRPRPVRDARPPGPGLRRPGRGTD